MNPQINAPQDDGLDEIDYEEFIQQKNNSEKQQSQNISPYESIKENVVNPLLYGAVGSKKEVKRHIDRTLARVGETAVGSFGNLRDVMQMAGTWAGKKGRSLLGKDPLTESQEKELKENQNILDDLVDLFPTSSDLRENVTKKLTGNQLEPQSEAEEFIDEITQDFASMLVPIGGKVSLAKALGQSVIANAGSEVAKAFGGDAAAKYTKMGLFFGTGMIGDGTGLRQFTTNLYKNMRNSIPEGAELSANNLSRRMNQLESRLRLGDPSAGSKQAALNKVTQINEKINNGNMPVEDAVQFLADTNEEIFRHANLTRSQNALYDVRNSLYETLDEYGVQNPTFRESHRVAQEVFAATETSKRVGSWVSKNIKPKDYLYSLSLLSAGGGVAGLPATIAAVVGAGSVGATAYASEVMRRMAVSPTLRRYYTNVITNSLNQNKEAFARNINQLEKGLEKSFEENPIKTVDFDDDEE